VLDVDPIENEKSVKIAIQPFIVRLTVRKTLLKTYKIRGVGVKQGVKIHIFLFCRYHRQKRGSGRCKEFEKRK